MKKLLTVLAFALTASATNALEVELKADNQPIEPTTKRASQLELSLFAELAPVDVPFRYKADINDKVMGYFPAGEVTRVLHWGNPFVMVTFQDMAGWVSNDYIRTLVTPDGRDWVRPAIATPPAPKK